MPLDQHENSDSVTPILDQVLATLPPPDFKQTQIMRFKVVTEAWTRLSPKITAGTLTQRDVERELSNFPDMGGLQEAKTQLVKLLQMNLPDYDIRKLPAE